jgi:hypothetical protein
MADLVAKNILSPSGGEEFFPDQSVLVTFDNISYPDDQFYFDLFVTLNYDGIDNSNWDFIARLPIGVREYELLFKKPIFGNNIRLATCGVSRRGIRSIKNVMSKSFSFRPRLVRDPVLINPVPNKSYSNNIEILIDNSYLNYSEKSNIRFYSYFSSNFLGVLNSPIAERVDSGISQIKWNISNLPNSDDYEILCYYSDDLGNRSSDVIIKNLKITNPGLCIIDTEPPQTAIKIQNDSEYISDPTISIQLYSYDDTTGINGFIFKELRFNEDNEIQVVKKSEPRNYDINNFYTVLDEDGKTYIGALVEDVAGNRTDYSLDYNSSLTYNINYFRSSNLNIENFNVTASSSDGASAYFAVEKNNSYYLYRKTEIFTMVQQLPLPCIAIKNFADDVIMSFENSNRSLEIKRFTNNTLFEIYVSGSKNTMCNSIEFYKNSYYLGCDDGSLYRLHASSVSIVADINTFKKPIRLIEKTKNNVMNIYINLGAEIYSFDGQNIVRSDILI